MPTIITASLNGPIVHRGQNPTVPYMPSEIAAEAERAWNAGASVVHVHAREEGGSPSYRIERYREVVNAVRDRCPALVSVSTGAVGVSLEDRMAPLEARPDLAQLPCGTMNYARWNEKQETFDFDHVFANPYRDVLAIATRVRELSIRPIAACYDLGHVAALTNLVRMGRLETPLVRSIGVGVWGGIAGTTHNLCRMQEATPEDLRGPWTLMTMGGMDWKLMAGALSIGGHVRAGFQDGMSLPDGELADSNGALVEATVRLIQSVGGEVATVDQAREILGISPRA